MEQNLIKYVFKTIIISNVCAKDKNKTKFYMVGNKWNVKCFG